MRRIFLAFVLSLACGDMTKAQLSQSSFSPYPDHLTRADLNFFFDSVYFRNNQWEFHLSRNIHQMVSRIRTDKSDITGACESGEVLFIPEEASLEIKGKDLSLLFFQGIDGHEFRLTHKKGTLLPGEPETQWAYIHQNSDLNNGDLEMFFPED